MSDIAIINYGAGNLRSVNNAIVKLGYRVEITNQSEGILKAKAVVFPGVGAAGDTMSALTKLNLVPAIRQLVAEKRPLLCICIGLQVLYTGTEEGGWYDCLDVIKGKVRKLPAGLKVPHMGWNQIKHKKTHPVFKGIPDGSNFYFVHSYYGEPEDRSVVLAETEYGITFASAVGRDNLIAVQFHPERSGDLGLQFYENFFTFAGVKKTV
jgi:imidazole glycerol-phosphate synthase subunit HisH